MPEIGIVVLLVVLAGLMAWRWEQADRDVELHTGRPRPFATRHHWTDHQEQP